MQFQLYLNVLQGKRGGLLYETPASQDNGSHKKLNFSSKYYTRYKLIFYICFKICVKHAVRKSVGFLIKPLYL